ncbi:unnamed protein product [marine sediment metagenome]|uniref:Uncharacterized protein n=1 Tax=marine sediment metagenome TaxID=412755 RepID=X1GPB3_9ZZZZ
MSEIIRAYILLIIGVATIVIILYIVYSDWYKRKKDFDKDWIKKLLESDIE